MDVLDPCMTRMSVPHKPVRKTRGRPVMSVRLDAAQIRRFFHVARKLDEPDASALMRKLVLAIIEGDSARRQVLGEIFSKLDDLERQQAMLAFQRQQAKAARSDPPAAGMGVPG